MEKRRYDQNNTMASSPAATQPIHTASNTRRVLVGDACNGRLKSKVVAANPISTSATEINSFNTAVSPIFDEKTTQSWSRNGQKVQRFAPIKARASVWKLPHNPRLQD